MGSCRIEGTGASRSSRLHSLSVTRHFVGFAEILQSHFMSVSGTPCFQNDMELKPDTAAGIIGREINRNAVYEAYTESELFAANVRGCRCPVFYVFRQRPSSIPFLL